MFFTPLFPMKSNVIYLRMEKSETRLNEIWRIHNFHYYILNNIIFKYDNAA